MRRVWVMSPLDQEAGDVWARAWGINRRDGFISMGWGIGKNARGLTRKEIERELRKQVRQHRPGFSIKAAAAMICDFYNEIRPGDTIIARRGLSSLMGLGTVVGTPYYQRSKLKEIPSEWRFENHIDVKWSARYKELYVGRIFTRPTLYRASERTMSKLPNFLQLKERTATYLLTWNPKRWAWEGFGKYYQRFQKRGKSHNQWTTNSRKIKKGDRVFLLKQGKGVTGLIASGYTTGQPYEDEHYSDPTKTCWYVPIEFDALVDWEREHPLLSSKLKKGFLSSIHWDTQTSGININNKAAEKLERIWASFIRAKSKERITSSSAQSGKAFERKVTQAMKMDPEALRKKALQASSVPEDVVRQGSTLKRNPHIAAYVRSQAHGACCLCLKKAPFKNRRGDPFLEIHHIASLSDGGKDAIENTVALCPNCHRKMHILNQPMDKERLLSAAGKNARAVISVPRRKGL